MMIIMNDDGQADDDFDDRQTDAGDTFSKLAGSSNGADDTVHRDSAAARRDLGSEKRDADDDTKDHGIDDGGMGLS